MKFLIAFIIVVAVSFAQAQNSEQQEKLKQHHIECSKQVPVDKELVDKAGKGDFVDNVALKNFFTCVGKRSGFVNEAGEIQKEVLLKKTAAAAGDEIAKKLVDACAVQAGPDTTFNVAKCYWEKSAPNPIRLV